MSTTTTTATDAPTRALTRCDGRQPFELRGRELKVSVSPQFDGSCFYAQGNSAVYVFLHGPTGASKRMSAGDEAFQKASVRVRVLHADSIPTAGGAERVGQQERKAAQQSTDDAHGLLSLLERLIASVFISDRYPRAVLCVDVTILSEDGAMVATAVNAVMAALLDAGVPCRTTIAAVGVAALLGPSLTGGHPNSENDKRRTATRTSAAGGGKRARHASSQEEECTRGSIEKGYHDCKHEQEEDSLVYVLDPNAAEESGRDAGIRINNSISSASLSTATAAAVTLSSSSTVSANLPEHYRCVAHGVFVFSNPACGGGLLCSHVHRSGGGYTYGGRATCENVSARQWLAMASLAEKASTVVFEFLRQCNVPLA